MSGASERSSQHDRPAQDNLQHDSAADFDFGGDVTVDSRPTHDDDTNTMGDEHPVSDGNVSITDDEGSTSSNPVDKDSNSSTEPPPSGTMPARGSSESTSVSQHDNTSVESG